jgi:hypothetical protein
LDSFKIETMLRVIISSAFVSILAMFGTLGAKDKQTILFCISVAIIACGLGIWRAYVTYRKRSERNERQRLFIEHMRRNMRANRY